jgi:uncharacterized protein
MTLCIFATKNQMKRSKLTDLIEWKHSENRKPLLLRGARQVGKTWLIKEFGNTHYDQMVYINLEKNKRLKNLFQDDFDVKRIVTALQAESGLKILPDTTLIVFDEIQAIPEAITALKYFCEDAPEYHIIAAGSLLGVALHTHTSFPVGKVQFLDLNPLSFTEFLEAMGESMYVDILSRDDWTLTTAMKTKFIERLRQYYFVGGMPEAVSHFSANGDFSKVRVIHEQILEAFEQDFSKYAPAAIVPRIRMLWNSVPSQLARENRKFIYGAIKEGARAKDYEIALSWLIDCGLVHKVMRITKPAIPAKAYEDSSAFKLFLVDVGLLSALCEIDSSTLLKGNEMFTEFKGSLTEQFVLQQLIILHKSVYYWSADRSTSEIDFLIQSEGKILPIEVKAEENLQAKSLKVFRDKFSPEVSIRLSMSDYRKQDWLVNIPLYAVNRLSEIINKS